MTNRYSTSLEERLVSGLSYVSAGWLGFIYMIVLAVKRKNPTYFLRYNVMQSIFVSLLYFVLCFVIGFACNLLLKIPFINSIVSWILLIFNQPILLKYSIVEIFVYSLILYMALLSFLGRYPRIFFVSKIIDSAAR